MPLPAAIGKYQVLERAGIGGMGVVYKCLQPGLERPVAVKVLSLAAKSSTRELLRFQREAQAASRLPHPNIVQVYDVGSERELNYFVMEYVDGWPLNKLIGTPVLTLERTLYIVYHVARALQAAHEQGLIHRDIKPSNILLDKSGQPKVADFGLAKSLTDSLNLSGSGDLIGTPKYMSPEQALSAPEDVDARTDVYSLGAVFYEMLTGRPPVDGPNVLAVMRKLVDEEHVPVRELNPAIPGDIAAVCERALVKEREQRFAGASQLAEAVQNCLWARVFGQPEIRELPTQPDWPALPVAPPRNRRWPHWRLGVGASLLIGSLLLLPAGRALYKAMVPPPAALPGQDSREAEESAPPGPGSAAGALKSKLVDESRAHFNSSLNLPPNATPRDRVKAVLENLTTVLKRAPDDGDVRLLRAKAFRQAGEYLAAIDDLDRLLAHDPNSLAAVVERLLANYHLYILYLCNLDEPVVRPPATGRVRDDVQTLERRGTSAHRRLAALVEALANQDHIRAGQLAESSLPRDTGRDFLADLAVVEGDALFHAAEAAYGEELTSEEGQKKENARLRREELVRKAVQALRRGLDADPNHVGLLFLKANSFHLRPVWEGAETEDREATIRRQRPGFEAALDRLRNVTLRIGCDTAVARAVLLCNFGRENLALEQVNDALSCRPTVPFLHSLKAWLRLQTPPDGTLTAEEANHVLRDLQASFDVPPEDFNPYFVRALVYASAGNWEEARRDLRQCRRKLGKDTLPTGQSFYQAWFAQASTATTRYLDASQELLWNLPVPMDLRIRLSEEILKRLGDTALVQQDGLTPAEVQTIKGWTHVRLARTSAAKEEGPDRVLHHVREALQLRLADLTPKTFRDEQTFAAWNENEKFKAVYAQFEKK
jgi:serine/threonine protein kinase